MCVWIGRVKEELGNLGSPGRMAMIQTCICVFNLFEGTAVLVTIM